MFTKDAERFYSEYILNKQEKIPLFKWMLQFFSVGSDVHKLFHCTFHKCLTWNE